MARHHITDGSPCWCKPMVIMVPPNALADALGVASESIARFTAAIRAFSVRRPALIHNGGKPRRRK